MASNETEIANWTCEETARWASEHFSDDVVKRFEGMELVAVRKHISGVGIFVCSHFTNYVLLVVTYAVFVVPLYICSTYYMA